MSRKAKASTEHMSTVEPEVLSVVPAQPAAPYHPHPLLILSKAIDAGADVEKIQKLMDLAERWEKNEAKKAFDAALAAFKENPPDIIKNKAVDYPTKAGGTVKYRHATLDNVTTRIGKALAKHGLSATWSTEQVNGLIRVTCKLRHRLGHEEPTTLEGPPDDSGFKSPVQQIASTVSFLERYTLLAACGMATRDDTDGISFADLEDSVNSIRSAATMDELQERFNAAYKRAFTSHSKEGMAICIEAKDQRKKELAGGVPGSQVAPDTPEAKAKALARLQEFEALATAKGMNQANRHMFLAEHQSLDAAMEALKKLPAGPEATVPVTSAASADVETAPASSEARPAKKGQAKKSKEVRQGTPTDSTGAPAPKEPEWGF